MKKELLQTPVLSGKWSFLPFGGISKREWFASMAMQGLITCDGSFGWTFERIAEQSFKQADAMIKISESETGK